MNISDWRLRNQRIAGPDFKRPGEVVAWMGAVQAQDYLGALWALGLRMETATEAAVEQAIAERTSRTGIAPPCSTRPMAGSSPATGSSPFAQLKKKERQAVALAAEPRRRLPPG